MIQLRLPFASRHRRRVGIEPTYLEDIPAYGHVLSKKEKGCCRVAFQNIHGLVNQAQLTGTGIEELGSMAELDIDALGLLETNLNWTQEARA